jgi:hypothetical protein
LAKNKLQKALARPKFSKEKFTELTWKGMMSISMGEVSRINKIILFH